MNADVHALAGAYALNALPPDEAAAFAEHLLDCSPCRLEVAELQATAAQLGVAAAEEPPETLPGRVMHAVRQTRQAPPPAGHGDADGAGSGTSSGAPGGVRRRRRRRRRRALVLSSAAAVAIVLGLGLLVLRPIVGGLGETDTDSHVMAVMHAPDARTSTTGVRGGGSLTVISSRKMGAAVVMGDRLPALDPNHDYQLWLVDRAGRPRSTGMLIDASEPRPTGPMMVEGIHPGDHIALSLERTGGSARPTMPLLAMTRRA